MTLPKKKRRKIVIDNQTYYWISSRNPDRITFVAENAIKNKLLATFDYNTLHQTSSYYVFPFVITPFVARTTILYAIEQGYSNQSKSKDLNLGNLSHLIHWSSLAERKTKKLLESISIQNLNDHSETQDDQKDGINFIIKETNDLIKVGELLVALENMMDNLFEIKYQFKKDELVLIKEISDMSPKLKWRKGWDKDVN